jgi:hypothetical protein
VYAVISGMLLLVVCMYVYLSSPRVCYVCVLYVMYVCHMICMS